MPGYRTVVARDPLADHLSPMSFETIDHCVGNDLHALSISLFQ